jgi:hypothetical protein
MASDDIPYSGPIVTRAEAMAAGLKRYFTGECCKRSHVAERFVCDYVCVECSRIKDASPQERERRREYMAAWQKSYRTKYPERHRASKLKPGHAVLAAKRRERRAKDPSKDRAALSRSFQKHKAKRMAEAKAWKEANPEKYTAIQKAGKANRRALEKAATGRISKADVLHLFEVQLGMCAADDCRADLANGFHLDHIHSLRRGGPNDIGNAQLLCPPCNRSKGAKTMEEWAAWKQKH